MKKLLLCSLLIPSLSAFSCSEPQPRSPNPGRAAGVAPSADVVTEPARTEKPQGLEERALRPTQQLDLTSFEGLTGTVTIDGSSTVFPLTELIAGVYEGLAADVTVRLGVSGTGGGFSKFCRGETEISNASRPIKSAEQLACAEAGVEFVEVPIAYDGISVVVNAANDWAQCVTVDELGALWAPAAKGRIDRWSDVRNDWPRRTVQLFAPGQDSGTFDYFTRAVIGQEGDARSDFTGSEDDYLLAQDVADNVDALGFFGFAYFTEYRGRLRSVAIDAGAGCVTPTLESIGDGRYRPLSRPLFIYLAVAALDRPEVARFVDLYLDTAGSAATRAGYVPLPDGAYALTRSRVARRIPGSLWSGGSQVGVSIEELLTLEREATR